jgi:LAO/AO transport system kinase
MKPFFVYMLRCSDGSFYVGHTDELELRVAQHQTGEIDGYTQTRRPVQMVWCQETASRLEALSAERQIKGWGRAKKEALIAGDWDLVSQLAKAYGGRAGLNQASASEHKPHPFRTEPVEVPGEREAGLRQAQPERGVLGEPERGVGSELERGVVGEPERGAVAELAKGVASLKNTERKPLPVRTEPVEVPSKHQAGLRQAQPERSVGEVQDKGGAQEPNPRTSRRALAKSITLLESTRPDHRARADALLNTILPHTGQAMRLGISGVPGVGKSTFIETLGLALIKQGHRVAVLAIDPSSSVSGGSILGDKTRMEMLSVNEAAYIRPSPASGTLGGVAEKTREAMLVCEAAGYDVVIVETVGVGQSEIAVASMTDMFVLLQLPNAGDDLQAIKKGVMELADLVVINKADIDSAAATRAEAQITGVLRIFTPHGDPHAVDSRWHTKVMQMSALKGQGLDTFLAHVKQFHDLRRSSGELTARRQQQAMAWMWDLVHARLQADFHDHPAVKQALPQTLNDVTHSRIAPSAAARLLLNLKSNN